MWLVLEHIADVLAKCMSACWRTSLFSISLSDVLTLAFSKKKPAELKIAEKPVDHQNELLDTTTEKQSHEWLKLLAINFF